MQSHIQVYVETQIVPPGFLLTWEGRLDHYYLWSYDLYKSVFCELILAKEVPIYFD